MSIASRNGAALDPVAVEAETREHRVVHHFGPDPAYVGGMGSVMRVLAEHRMGGDAIEVHPTWRPDSSLASLPLALRAAPSVRHIGRSDVAHVHLAEDGSFVREGALVVLARSLKKTTVVTVHGGDFVPFSYKHPRLASLVLRCAHLIICLNSGVLDRARQVAPQTRVELLPNPVAVPEDSPGADETEELVLFAGRIGVRKGVDVLWRAWRLVAESCPRARCIMVGPAYDYTVAPTPRLEVRSSVNADGMKDLLRSARVVALPSYSEGMPMVLLEAMSHGRPFVATPVGGIPELADAGGVLVPVGDEVALAECLIEMLSDRALARSIGERGRQFCRATRSVELIDARLNDLYSAASQARSTGVHLW
jgi:glycosyltransferase involved in cell wall biosynthesis